MHLSTMITHLTLNQNQAGQPHWYRAPSKQAIADRKSEKLKRQWSQAITLLLYMRTSMLQCAPF